VSTVDDIALNMPLSGIQFIEASAGTGKTYALVSLYVRLLIERNVSVRQILVVTFTKSATQELKSRLRERLILCLEIATNMDNFSAQEKLSHAQTLCLYLINRALKKESKNSLQTRLRIAVLSMDEAQVSTIHSFCQRVLREHVFFISSETTSNALHANDNDLVATIAGDLWREQAVSADRIAYDAFVDVAVDLKKFSQLLRNILASRSLLLPYITSDVTLAHTRIDLSRKAWKELSAHWVSTGESAFDALIAHHSEGHFNESKLRRKTILLHRKLLAQSFTHNIPPDDKLLALYTNDSLNEKRKKTGHLFPEQNFFGEVAKFLRINTVAKEAHRQLGIQALHNACVQARERLTRIKHETGRLCFDDMVEELHTALHDDVRKTLAYSVQKQFPYALIDEFQDTDRRQFDIFKTIYNNGRVMNTGLFLIGDPKQAIYRFRGGDIVTYLDARDTANACHTLSANFRSTPAYLAAIEALYAVNNEKAFCDARIRFTPVTAGGSVDDHAFLIDGLPAKPLTLWHLEKTDSSSNKAENSQRLAEACAASIVELLNKAQENNAHIIVPSMTGDQKYRRLKEGDIAVLVNTHKQTTLLQSVFSRVGIPSVCISKQSVFSTQEAIELHTLLGALSTFNEMHLRAALSTVLLGGTLKSLDQLNNSLTLWHEKLKWFSDLRRKWQNNGIVAVLESILEDRAAALLSLEYGERRVSNWMQLADLLQKETAHNVSLQALVDWLERRIALADEENEEEQLRLESDANRVQILTLHKSKGLEFPVVFLPFAALCRDAPSQYPKLYRYHRVDKTPAVYFVSDKEAASNQGAVEAAAVEDREECAERRRLLYVGLTRARYACYAAVGALGRQEDAPALADMLQVTQATDYSYLLSLFTNTPSIHVTKLPVLNDVRPYQDSNIFVGSGRRFNKKINNNWWMHSFSQLHSGGDFSAQVILEDESIAPTYVAADSESVLTLPRGARFGTAIHNILEHTDFLDWFGWDKKYAPKKQQQQLIENTLQHHAFVSDREWPVFINTVVQLVTATLNTVLPAGVCLAQLPIEARCAELEFHFSIAGADTQALLQLLQQFGYQAERDYFNITQSKIQGLMHGLIDLVFLHQGRWYVVDYKTNDLGAQYGDYAPSRLKEAVRANEYDLQYLIYLTALHRWLKNRLGMAYDINRDLGGAIYLFVRGLNSGGTTGVYFDNPNPQLIEQLDALLSPPLQMSA